MIKGTERTAAAKKLVQLFESGHYRFSQERSDFLLPQVLDYIQSKQWMNLRPEYQRRQVWNRPKRSRLIESLLMNVPVPPVFLFENELNRYEVMDGQQRLNSISDFYNNRLELKGLTKWTELDGYKYKDLPETLKRGLDRRRISATVITFESASINQDKEDLRSLVFERLNTGGQSLNAQEIRNSIYAGAFNALLVEMSSMKLFTQMWGIPAHKVDEDSPSRALLENKLYSRMIDCETVLRFFTFRVPLLQIRGSPKAMMDRYMRSHRNPSDDAIVKLRDTFRSRLLLAHEIFGMNAFVLPIPESDEERHSRPLFDAIMITLDRLFDKRDALITAKQKIQRALSRELQKDSFYALVVNRANTSKDLRRRLRRCEALFRTAL